MKYCPSIKNKTLIMGLSLGVLIYLLLGTEAHAFQPVINKTNSIAENLLHVAEAVIGLALVWFIYTLFANRPNWKFLGLIILAGVLIGGYAFFKGYLGGR